MNDVINTVSHKNFLDNTLPDKCAQLIIADPPYFEVKGDFDFIWKSFDYYLKDVEKWAIECKRLLADNGTLFWWGNSKKIAYSQIIIDKYLFLQNSLVWRKKDSIQMTMGSVDLARRFTTHNERVLMYTNKDEDRYLIENNNPFSVYLKDEFKRAKVTNKEISKLFPSNTGGLTGCVSNWLNGLYVINEVQYGEIRKYLGDGYLQKDYSILKIEYEELYKEYQLTRRYFYNPRKIEEVMDFSQQSNITKNYDHDTCKPETLTRELILSCSRPNDLVIVPFAGSGTECSMSILEGRNFYGYEIEEKHVNTSNKRVKEILRKPQLF